MKHRHKGLVRYRTTKGKIKLRKRPLHRKSRANLPNTMGGDSGWLMDDTGRFIGRAPSTQNISPDKVAYFGVDSTRPKRDKATGQILGRTEGDTGDIVSI